MITVQMAGFVALLLDLFSVQFKHRKTILYIQILASTVWVGHFFLLAAYAGATMNFIGVIRSLGYYVFRNKRRWWMPWVIVLLTLGGTILTWQGIISLLPMFAMMLSAFAFWQKGEQAIRILLLFCAPLWFAYNYVSGSYAGMISDVIALVSTSFALYHYRKQGMKPATVEG